MIIARAPLRVSLFGGGTDFPAYYRQHGGLCVAATIDKYVYVVVKRRYDDAIRVSYTETEIVKHVMYLRHGLIREALRLADVTSGVEVVTLADIPGNGSGLASSSAVTVATLAALQPGGERDHLINQAILIECDILGQSRGHQDQIAVTKGGLISMAFGPPAEPGIREAQYPVTRLAAAQYAPFVAEFNNHFLLFKIPTVSRDGAAILNDQDGRIAENTAGLREIAAIAQRAVLSIAPGDFREWGQWLNESWQIKRELSPEITNDTIDAMHTLALDAGAAGAKVCGAGGGGYLLVYCPGAVVGVREAFASYDELVFKFESGGVTCKRLY